MSAKSMNIAKNYLTGKLKCAEFALTNSCIAKCSFCNIWQQKPKVFVDREKGLKALDILADFGVSHMCFTGGEALMHPNVVEFVEKATKRKIHSAMLLAAPSLLLRNDMVKRLESAGNDVLSISFDSEDPEIMAQSRQIPNIIDDMKKAIELIKKTKIKSMASVLIWNNNYDKLEEVCKAARHMGYDYISLNYPTFSESSVYVLGGEGINLSRENIIQGLETAIALKKAKKYKIVNTTAGMENIVNYLKDPESVKFRCFGGRHVMFVDWFFDVYACMQLPKPIGNIFDMKEKDLHIPTCNQCNMSWYRDLSIYFHGVRSLPVLFEAFRQSGDFL